MSLREEQFPLAKPQKSGWHVLRVTYGREHKAGDYLEDHGIQTYIPMQKVVKRVDGHLRHLDETLMRNLFFAFGTEDELREYVFDNIHLPFLRFYYRHYRSSDGEERKQPLVVPDRQMQDFRTIWESTEDDTIVAPGALRRFQLGQPVRVVRGPFAGVEGRVARYKGQQRVGVILDGLLTAVTTYIPSPALETLAP